VAYGHGRGYAGGDPRTGDNRWQPLGDDGYHPQRSDEYRGVRASLPPRESPPPHPGHLNGGFSYSSGGGPAGPGSNNVLMRSRSSTPLPPSGRYTRSSTAGMGGPPDHYSPGCDSGSGGDTRGKRRLMGIGKTRKSATWARDEDRRLVQLVYEETVASGRVKSGISQEEAATVASSVAAHAKMWSKVASNLPGRSGKQCRERWLNQLQPGIKRGAWTEKEEETLRTAHEELGNRWVQIALRLPGRTDNCVKNHWNSMLRKQQRREAALATAAAANRAVTSPMDHGRPPQRQAYSWPLSTLQPPFQPVGASPPVAQGPLPLAPPHVSLGGHVGHGASPPYGGDEVNGLGGMNGVHGLNGAGGSGGPTGAVGGPYDAPSPLAPSSPALGNGGRQYPLRSAGNGPAYSPSGPPRPLGGVYRPPSFGANPLGSGVSYPYNTPPKHSPLPDEGSRTLRSLTPTSTLGGSGRLLGSTGGSGNRGTPPQATTKNPLLSLATAALSRPTTSLTPDSRLTYTSRSPTLSPVPLSFSGEAAQAGGHGGGGSGSGGGGGGGGSGGGGNGGGGGSGLHGQQHPSSSLPFRPSLPALSGGMSQIPSLSMPSHLSRQPIKLPPMQMVATAHGDGGRPPEPGVGPPSLAGAAGPLPSMDTGGHLRPAFEARSRTRAASGVAAPVYVPAGGGGGRMYAPASSTFCGGPADGSHLLCRDEEGTE